MSATCTMPGCVKPVRARGLCPQHHQRLLRNGDPAVKTQRVPAPVICTIDGCDSRVHASGLCSGHWKRWRKHGDPLAGRARPGEPERYFREVVLAYDGDECLTWPYQKDGHGYGQLSRKGKNHTVSRLVCIEVNGPPPGPDYDAAHGCDNGHLACVAKRHVVWKTHADNMLDKKGKRKRRADRRPVEVERK